MPSAHPITLAEEENPACHFRVVRGSSRLSIKAAMGVPMPTYWTLFFLSKFLMHQTFMPQPLTYRKPKFMAWWSVKAHMPAPDLVEAGSESRAWPCWTIQWLR